MKISSNYAKFLAVGSGLFTAGAALAAGGIDGDLKNPDFHDYNTAGKPNVLVVVMDDLGYGQLNFDPSSFNKEVLTKYKILDRYKVDMDKAIEAAKKSTPTLRSLQDQGVAFKEAFVSHAVSGPSRAAFMTSQFPSKLGVYSNEDSEAGLDPSKKWLPILFQQYGYNTSAIGKWHLSSLRKVPVPPDQKTRDYHKNRNQYATDATQPQLRGFSYFWGFHGSGASYYDSPALFENRHHIRETRYIADAMTDKAIARIQKSGDEPFFIYLAYNAPHIPLEQHAPEKYRIFNTGNEEVDKYYEAIYAVDQNVNRVIEELKHQGKFDNTVILFWSDNGAVIDAPLPMNGPFTKGNKGMTFNGGTHIPAFITWKDKIKPGTFDKMVGAIDFMPTALAAAEIPLPKEWAKEIDGVNLLPFITGEDKGNPHDHLLWVQPRAYHWNAINEEFWVNYDEYVSYKAKDNSKVKGSEYVEKKSNFSYTYRTNEYTLHYYDDNGKGVFELYNLRKDPAEENNLINVLPEVAKELKAKMAEYLTTDAAIPRTELNVKKLEQFKKDLGLDK